MLYISGLGSKIVECSDGGTKFFVTNHLGTIAARLDLSGQTMEIYRHLPCGERYAGNHTPHQYTGKERDAESGLDSFGARYYASARGRWMSVDSASSGNRNPKRLNRYSYVGNGPIGTIDPDGREWVPGGCRTQWYYPPTWTEMPPIPYEVCYSYWNIRHAFFKSEQEDRGGGGIGHQPDIEDQLPCTDGPADQFVHTFAADFTTAATEANVDVTFLVALAGFESGWGSGPVATQFNNYFGQTTTPDDPDAGYLEGGTIPWKRYYTFEASISDFVFRWGDRISGSGTFSDFLNSLLEPPNGVQFRTKI